MIQKLSTVTGQVPTVAPSDNHVDGTWDSLDVYIGELFMNAADGKMWCRTNNGIKEIFVVPNNAATGDVFYLSGGNITRLPVGTSGQVLTVSSGNVPTWEDAAGANDSQTSLWNIDAPFVTAFKNDNSALDDTTTGRLTQLLPVYVPFDAEVDFFRTQTTTSGTLCLVSFGIYSFTTPIGTNQEFQLIGGATDYDCSSVGIHDVTPDNPISLKKGWYMLAMFRNSAAALQGFLCFNNGSLLPVFGWNDFDKGKSQKVYYENTLTNLASAGLPSTIDSSNDLNYSGAANILAYAIKLIVP